MNLLVLIHHNKSFVGIYIFVPLVHEIGITVPVEAAYQVWRVTKVLSMGKVHTHI